MNLPKLWGIINDYYCFKSLSFGITCYTANLLKVGFLKEMTKRGFDFMDTKYKYQGDYINIFVRKAHFPIFHIVFLKRGKQGFSQTNDYGIPQKNTH